VLPKLLPGENGGFRLTLLFCWRPRRDLNPCYRRERIWSAGNLLKLEGADGSQSTSRTVSGAFIGRQLDASFALLAINPVLWLRLPTVKGNRWNQAERTALLYRAGPPGNRVVPLSCIRPLPCWPLSIVVVSLFAAPAVVLTTSKNESFDSTRETP
jgi:hypothetical protein